MMEGGVVKEADTYVAAGGSMSLSGCHSARLPSSERLWPGTVLCHHQQAEQQRRHTGRRPYLGT